jgi:magnesium transporter
MSKLKHRKRRRFRIRRKAQPGLVPGTIQPEPASPPSTIEVICYGPDGIEETTITHPRQLEALMEKWPVTWVNVDGFGDGTAIRQLGEFLGLHRLALEDVVNLHQRPKIDDYNDYLFIVAQMMKANDQEPPEQLSIFLGRNFVATFSSRPDGDCFDPVRERIRKSKGRLRNAAPDYLAYALLDTLVDVYFPVLERLSDRIDAIELNVDRNQSHAVMADIHDIRSDLLVVRRAIWPLRDALNTIVRETHELIAQETRVYLRDCYDHTVQIIDLAELYRDLCGDLRDFIISLVSQRTNEIMRVLTVIATIFMPLSFVAGFYGMNFDPGASPLNMPELKWYFGYPFAILLMLAIASSQLYFFKRKGWLWRRRD